MTVEAKPISLTAARALQNTVAMHPSDIPSSWKKKGSLVELVSVNKRFRTLNTSTNVKRGTVALDSAMMQSAGIFTGDSVCVLPVVS
jgi:hypothetical protein